jgi:hypothetical protein
MEPKFQSSFIPKGPVTSSTTVGIPTGRKTKERSFFSFLAIVIFIISVLLALGMFGYKFYLKYRIETMSADLEKARVAIQPDIIRELTRLDNRIVSTKELISEHRVLTPLFEFLEISAPRTVRFTDFRYTTTDKDTVLTLKGEARGYAALALQADIFDKSQYFHNSIFSDLNLNTRGDVSFSLTASVDPNLVSYNRGIERTGTKPE